MIKTFPIVELEPEQAPLERLRRWVAKFGTCRLGRSLGIEPRSVQRYTSGERHPNLAIGKIIIALSQVEPLDGLPLTYEDIYGPVRTSKVATRAVKKVQAWE